MYQYPTEVCGIQCDGVHEEEECDIDCEEPHGTEEELHRGELLGKGYFVSTVGFDEEAVKEYIRTQEKEDERLDQLSLGFEEPSPSGDS